MIKTKTIAKGKCFGSPARRRDSLVLMYQNIFPLANTFAKRENVRPGQSPIGTQMRSFYTFLCGACRRHWISSSRIYGKLDYISSLLPQTPCLGKICGPRYLGPKLAKSAIFSIFFSFSNITFEIFIFEENFWIHKYRTHQTASFGVFGMSLR